MLPDEYDVSDEAPGAVGMYSTGDCTLAHDHHPAPRYVLGTPY